jgi:hypothetical protein
MDVMAPIIVSGPADARDKMMPLIASSIVTATAELDTSRQITHQC